MPPARTLSPGSSQHRPHSNSGQETETSSGGSWPRLCGQLASPLSAAPEAPVAHRRQAKRAPRKAAGCPPSRLHTPAVLRTAHPRSQPLFRARREPELRGWSRPPRPKTPAGREISDCRLRKPRPQTGGRDGRVRPGRGAGLRGGGPGLHGACAAHSPRQTTASCARALGAPSGPAAARCSMPGPAAGGRRLLPPGSGSGSGSGSRGGCGPGAGGGEGGVFVRRRCRPAARGATSAAASRAPWGLSGGRQGGLPPAAAPAPRAPRRGQPVPQGLQRAHAPRRAAPPVRARRPRATPRCAQPDRRVPPVLRPWVCRSAIWLRHLSPH